MSGKWIKNNGTYIIVDGSFFRFSQRNLLWQAGTGVKMRISEWIIQGKIWRKSISGKGKGKCKAPEVGLWLARVGHRKEVNISMEWLRSYSQDCIGYKIITRSRHSILRVMSGWWALKDFEEGSTFFFSLQKTFFHSLIPYKVLGTILGFVYCTSYQPTVAQTLFCYHHSNGTWD